VRVAWLVYGDLGQPTGGYIYDRLVVEGLRALGDEVTVVDPRSAGEGLAGADVIVGDGLCVRELGPLFERHRGGPARVLLVHHFPSWEVERTDRDVLRALERRSALASDVAVATSPATRERVVAEHPALRAEAVAPGADRLPRLPRAALGTAGGASLLFVGSLVARKRVSLLLDALEAVTGPRWPLVLVGDPGREPGHAASLRARVDASAALRSAVTFAGIETDDALASRFADAGALVLPSSLEGYGMVMGEALHAGLPVLAARPAADAAGLTGTPGTRVFDDAAGLARLLDALATDPSLRAALDGEAQAPRLPRWADAMSAFRAALLRAACRGP
jgi:glycosyltransferase involved in cell wall biosynthesis